MPALPNGCYLTTPRPSQTRAPTLGTGLNGVMGGAIVGLPAGLFGAGTDKCLRVYISSTFKDLKAHRERVYRQLRRVNHDVIAMEDYVAQDERPLANCLNDVACSDLYLGLFAWRYGYIPEEENPRRLSITELEYRHAISEGKECLVFVLDEDFEWPPRHAGLTHWRRRSGEAHQGAARRASTQKQVAFFKTPDDLAALVAAAVEKWTKKVELCKRNEASRLTIGELTPDKKIVVDRQIGRLRLLVLNDDICHASTDVIVSSDDNYFSARGGVSKLLLDKLGPGVRRELEHYRKAGFRQGQIAITTGGDWGRRAVIHAAVIDLDYDLYPTPEAIRIVTRRSLGCAAALGAGSIAFPVLGGGYATMRMNPSRLRPRHGYGDPRLHEGQGAGSGTAQVRSSSTSLTLKTMSGYPRHCWVQWDDAVPMNLARRIAHWDALLSRHRCRQLAVPSPHAVFASSRNSISESGSQRSPDIADEHMTSGFDLETRRSWSGTRPRSIQTASIWVLPKLLRTDVSCLNARVFFSPGAGAWVRRPTG